MSSNPPSFRLPFTLSPDVHPDVVAGLRYTFNKALDLDQAILALHGQVGALQKAQAAAGTTIINTVTTGGGPGGGTTPSVGGVNDQTGQTAYTLQQTDFGGIVVLNAASPTLTLNSMITSPFYCVVENFGSTAATIVPDSGTVTVNAVASVSLPADGSAILFWSSPLTWWMTTLPPMAPIPLVGVSTAIGGSVMTVGQTVKTTVAIAVAAVGMVAVTSPETYPGDGFCWDAYISSANTVTVRLTCVLAGTPTSSVYDVRVIQ